MLKLGKLALGFFLGALASGLVTAEVDVYLLGNFDSKFSPDEAFKIAAVGALLLALFGVVVLVAAGVVQNFVRSQASAGTVQPLFLGTVAGALYSLVPWAVHTGLGDTLQPESIVFLVLVWLYLAVYPVATLVLASAPFAGV